MLFLLNLVDNFLFIIFLHIFLETKIKSSLHPFSFHLQLNSHFLCFMKCSTIFSSCFYLKDPKKEKSFLLSRMKRISFAIFLHFSCTSQKNTERKVLPLTLLECASSRSCYQRWREEIIIYLLVFPSPQK